MVLTPKNFAIFADINSVFTYVVRLFEIRRFSRLYAKDR